MITLIRVPQYLAGLVLRVPKKKRRITITEWIKQDGEPVTDGDPIIVLDTVKASAEIVAEASGIVFHLKQVHDRVDVTDILGVVTDTAQEFRQYKKQHLEHTVQKTASDVRLPLQDQ